MANTTPKLQQRKDANGVLIIKNAPIVIDFTFDGKRMWIQTGERIDESKWDKKNAKVKPSVSGALEINELLRAKCEQLQKIYREAKIMGREPTVSYIRNSLNESKPNTSKSLLQLYDEFIEGHRVKASVSTVKILKTNKRHLTDFAKTARISLEFDIIDEPFLNKYVEYFQTELKHINGTIAKEIKVLKWFLNWASKFGYNKNYLYKSFAVKSQELEIIILTEDELFQLYNFELDNETFKQVRDVFCFCCFTSLRYSDVKNLKKEDVQGEFIHITTVKTKSRVSIPLIAFAKEILNTYKHKMGNTALPVISNQKMNDYLKDIAKLANLNRPISKVRYSGNTRIETIQPLYELITSHMGRKTFVSYMFRKGIDSELIRSISNHKSISSFARYNMIDNDHKADAMQIAFKRVS
jgi:integrase